MSTTTDQTIRSVVEQVLAKLGKTAPQSNGSHRPSSPGGIPVVSHGNGSAQSSTRASSGSLGVFGSVDDAVAAATDGFSRLCKATIADRVKAIDCVRRICDEQAEELGRLELDETKIGRLDHKIDKLKIIKLVPGVEFMRSDAVSGDNGLTVTEYAPFGVIGSITPVTHSLPTLAGNVINMLAAGNTIVFNPHPSGAKIACEGVRRFNTAIKAATGLENLINIIGEPTLETAEEIFNHRGIRLLVVTGGPGVARAALASRKRAIVAGPGNPPVVVDETADLDNAAAAIVKGAAFDNNLLCIGEKEVFAVNSIFDALLEAVGRNGGYRLSPRQIQQLTQAAFKPPEKPGGHWILNRDLVGKDPAVLAQAIGITVPAGTQILFGETDTANPFVPEEQMMPFVPFVRCQDFEQALALAIKHEHGFGHTAVIHSNNLAHITRMGQACNTTLFAVNGPSTGCLGVGGEGYPSYSIATPTGEGVTTPLTFTRFRRLTVSGALRIV
jgi:aldehyde dehydrogenase